MGAIVSTDPFTADVLDTAVDLRVIARVGVGLDSIDLDAATDAGRPGSDDARGQRAPVADHAVGLMLALLRRIPSSTGTSAPVVGTGPDPRRRGSSPAARPLASSGTGTSACGSRPGCGASTSGC